MTSPGYHSPTEQHMHLLHGTRFSNFPSSTAHLADQMEAGGAKIEETLQRMNCKYQTLFFLSSWGITLAAIMSIIQSMKTLRFANLIIALFLLMFGLVMMVLDIPGSPRWAGKYRSSVRKYVRILTRLSGKSLWNLYLGCMVMLTLWPPNAKRRPGGFLVIALGVSAFVIFVSFIGTFIAMRKSLRLERVRKCLQAHYKGNESEVFRKYAITDPSHGMQFDEFNRMCSDFTQGQLHFEIADLAIVYNALDDHQKSAINEREFLEWLAGPITYL